MINVRRSLPVSPNSPQNRHSGRFLLTLSALTTLLAASVCPGEESVATPAPQRPAWLQDYALASKKGRRERKPLVVVIGSGPAGWCQVTKEGQLGPQASRLLAANCVCLYVDTDRRGGPELAAAFAMSDGPGIVISDPSGEVQAFRHEGELSESQLIHYLRQFADPDPSAEGTETPAAVRVSNYQPGQTPAAPPVFAPPVAFPRSGAGPACST